MQISRLIYGSDIREYGSGNPGATNILRIFGWKAALAVFMVDVGKGGISALLAPRLQFADVSFPPGLLQFVAGAAAVIGHCYPLFAEFRGGKGVATAAGALLVTHPVAVALCSGVFMAVLIASRKVSVAAMVASLSMPVLLLMLRHRFGYADSTREASPLVEAAGAVVVDTSDLTVDQAADVIEEMLG